MDLKVAAVALALATVGGCSLVANGDPVLPFAFGGGTLNIGGKPVATALDAKTSNLVVAAMFDKPIDFGTGTIQPVPNADGGPQSSDVFVLSYGRWP